MNEAWTIRKILAWSNEYLQKNSIDSPKVTSQLLLCSVLKIPRLNLFLDIDRILSNTELASYKQYIIRRVNHEPLEYILGETDFIGHKVFVSPKVLIPRPETELLVQETINELKKITHKDLVIIDIGTGSGCIALSVKSEFPGAQVWASDISLPALEVAKVNAQSHNVSVNFYNGFFPSELKSVKDLIIVSNPPYIQSEVIGTLMPEVKDHEPKLALDGGKDGLDIIWQILDIFYQTQAKHLLMEIGYDQGLEISSKFKTEKLVGELSIIKDYNNLDRIVKISK